MESKSRLRGTEWRWSLLLSVVILNVCLPNLVLSYGVLFLHSVQLDDAPWLGLSTSTLHVLAFGLTQCWCRDAVDTWGGPVGYRVMAVLGLLVTVTSLLACAFVPNHLHPLLYGFIGGTGSSLVSAQVEAVLFDTYDSRLTLIKGLCLTGQAVGQSLFPHVMNALVDSYGYSFSFIVLSGIILQTLPAILLLKVDETVRPVSFSRYSDVAKTYAVFSNDAVNEYYTAELQLHDMSKKCWKSPSDDNLHPEGDNENCEDNPIATITPPPSPEEKRRNIFGVEILPEIPEESEESDDDNYVQSDNDANRKNKNRLSAAIRRLSTIGDNFDECIIKQIRRDSQSQSERDESGELREVEVTYDNISPITDIEREKIFNSFSFRCRSAYASMRRRVWMPSYRIYRLRRRLLYVIYNINDTFIKPLTRSLSCWRFYPALILCFTKLSLTSISLVMLPMIASQVQPKISMSESNFLMSLHGFTWICFLLCTPWLAQTPKRNFKYVALLGLMISTAACFLLSEAKDHDSFSIGCVVAGLGYGAIASSWETAVQDFVGVRKWPKFHSTLETLSGVTLAGFVTGLSFLIEREGFRYCMFVLGIALSVVTIVWAILAAISLYFTKVRSLGLRGNWVL